MILSIRLCTFPECRRSPFYSPPGLLFPSLLLADLPYKKVEWPADDRSHLDDKRVVSEWRYFTGKLTATQGKQTKVFGYYLMLQYLRDVTEDETYRFDALVPNQNKNSVWMGISSVNGQDVRGPNGSFATIENTLLD